MDPLSPFFAVAALAVAIGVTFLLAKRVGVPPASGRFVSIDGLRGYLAFFVFVHHSAVWYLFVRTGKWQFLPSNLYTHLGESSVDLFFMITGLLFWTKLINGRKKPINWLQLYVSRFLRLAPLYFFMLVLLVMLTGVVSNFILNEPILVLITEILRWSTFTILGSPEMNGIQGVTIPAAGPTWSLRYEWFFYFSLPLSAIFLRLRPPLLYLCLSVASMIALLLWHPESKYLTAFAGGIAAAFLVRWRPFVSRVNGPAGASIALLCIGSAIWFFPSAHSIAPLALLAAAFVIIACGNTMFGVLGLHISRALGQVSYSIYLLHSIVLFVVFRFVVGYDNAASLSPIEHWSLVLCCAAVLIPVCFATFHFIEAPAMRAVPRVTAWIESRLPRRSRGQAESQES